MSRRYGVWAGNPDGNPEDKTRCVEEIFPTRYFVSRQCSFKRVDGDYCGKHAESARKHAVLRAKYMNTDKETL